ncbi:MAG TPA: DHH family phosphoesterase [Candidatus Dojkabacteria bacterium]|nr:DHH family phosphoesterase [Candidatus Dojkabacteria bacterium]
MDINTDNILIGDSVYIVGHKKPDVDAVVSAFSYQIYRHSRGDFNYTAVRCDDVSPLTKWLFEKFNLDLPMLIRNVTGKKIVLVDHTDPVQRADGWENAEIIEVVDHHNLKLETTVPPKITIRPYGSTTTLVAQKLIRANVKIQPNIAGLMLAAIIDDTLALRSPITTYIDRSVAGQLAAIAGISDISGFARDIFDHKDLWLEMSADEIINTDIKSYEQNGLSLVITQVETMDNQKLSMKEADILAEMDRMNTMNPVNMRLVMLTDLLRNDCILLAVGDRVKDLESIFHTTLVNNNRMYLPGVLSRKKQLLPPILDFYANK